LRAGVISDLHAGVPHAGLGTIRRAVDALNARAPDVHLLLGDYLDASQLLKREIAPEVVANELARLHAPLGTIAVIGNHDWRNSGDRMWRALDAAGITVLEDRAVELANGVWIGPTWSRRSTTSRTTRPPSCSATTRICSRTCPSASRSRSPATRTAARSRSRSCAAR
jgi:predicted phosphodiesterase